MDEGRRVLSRNSAVIIEYPQAESSNICTKKRIIGHLNLNLETEILEENKRNSMFFFFLLNCVMFIVFHFHSVDFPVSQELETTVLKLFDTGF